MREAGAIGVVGVGMSGSAGTGVDADTEFEAGG